MARVDTYISEKVNECIKNNIQVNEDTIELFRKEYNMIRQRKILDKGRITDLRIIEHRKNRINVFREIPKKVILGVKTEPYYLTESEMMIGYVAPEYKELSKDEQEIWNELEKEKVA